MIPGENRDPVFEMVPDFRRDDVWTPAFAGVTLQKTFCEFIIFISPAQFDMILKRLH